MTTLAYFCLGFITALVLIAIMCDVSACMLSSKISQDEDLDLSTEERRRDAEDIHYS